MTEWIYAHRDLDEPPYPDGSPVLRPAVPVVVSSSLPAMLGVLDSGSPASVADATLFDLVGIDIERDEPLYELPLTVGGRFRPTPVFEVRLWLQPPVPGGAALPWDLARSPFRVEAAVRRAAGPARPVRPVPDTDRRNDVEC